MPYPIDMKKDGQDRQDGYDGEIDKSMLGKLVLVHPHRTDSGLQIVRSQLAHVYNGSFPADAYISRNEVVPVVFPGGKSHEIVNKRFVRGL
jgi:hypothetical protein